MRLGWYLLPLGLLAVGCQTDDPTGNGTVLPAPTNLGYRVEPSGTPGSPSGVVLFWDDSSDPDLESWNVYSRSSTGGSWLLRATTSSNSFHDNGQPQLQYYVTAVSVTGDESDASGTVTVDERLALEKPTSLSSVSLNGAIALYWSDNSYTSSPNGFAYYRIYSTSYDLDQDQCGATWLLEGTTVAPEFVSGSLTNGVPHCFGISAISIEGFESLWSPIRSDTPRPDARNVVVATRQADVSTSGFRYWLDQNGNGQAEPSELGRIRSGAGSDVDFSVDRDVAGRVYLTPVRAGTTVALYGNQPIADLTDIDVAPTLGFARSAIEAIPGWGYVFQTDGGDGFLRFGALRVTHVGKDLIIFDWSFQTDPGNPELVVVR